MNKPLHIIGYFHLAVPEHNAGSETSVWAALRAMVQRGHRVQIMCDRSATAPYTHDGIEVVRPPRRGQQTWIENYVKDADLLVTHLDLTSMAMMLALAVQKPLVHFVHNDAQLMYWRVIPLKAQLVVFNSEWIANKKCAWAHEGKPRLWEGPSIAIHPVVEPQYYRSERGSKITLVNPTPGKGVNTLKALARQMPDREFLVVEGGYGEQVIKEPYENVEWMAHTPNITEVFRKTKVLLMPSEYESYGRVGVEAACAGIPTIAHPTPGLLEAFGDAGIFIDRNDIASWYMEVDKLLTDDIYYRKRSDAVLALAASLTPESEFDRLETAFIGTVNRWKGEEVGQVKMWRSDRRIWRTEDGGFALESNGRIPSEAISLYVGIGGEVPEDTAIKHGWMSPPEEKREEKAIPAPPENKAIEAPEENKTLLSTASVKKRKSKVA